VEAIDICRTLFGDNPNDSLARVLTKLGIIYESQERLKEAEPLLLEAIAIYRTLVGDTPNNDLFWALTKLGIIYESQERLEEAEPLLLESLAIYRTLFGDSPSNNLSHLLNILGSLYKSQERWDEAEPLFLESLTICRTLFGDRPNIDLSSILVKLGSLYDSQERWDEAEPFLVESLAIYRTLVGDRPDENPSINLSIILNGLGSLYESQGKWEEAEPLLEDALVIRRTLFGDSPNNYLATSLDNLGELYLSLGRWTEAEPLLEDALVIRRTLFGDSPNEALASSLNNLGELYRYQEIWDKAKPFYHEALGIYLNLYSDRPNDKSANTMNNLGLLYKSQGRWREAESLYVRALAMREVLFSDCPNQQLTRSLNNLAQLYVSQERWKDAESFHLRALAISEALSQDRPNLLLAGSLRNLADLYLSQGRWDDAKPRFVRALAILEKLFDKTGHPHLVGTLTGLALAYAQQQQPELALPLFQKAIVSENLWLTNVIAINDAEQRMKDLEQRQYHLEFLLSLTQQYFPNDTQVVEKTFHAVLGRKAQAATAEANFSKALRNQPALAPDIEEYQAYQKEIATLSYAIGDRPDLKDRLSALLEQHNNLQKKLARSIPAIDLDQKVIDRQALTELLPSDAFLLEFVRYHDYDFIKRQWKAARYLAFIVRHDRAGVTAIDCGLAKPIDNAIEKFRSVFANSDFSGERSGFDDMFNQPTPEPAPQDPTLPDFLTLLLPHLPTSGTCYLAPDGDLHLLPFHLLKTSDGNYLGDRYHLHHLTTARDLYRQKFPTSTNPPAIFADPDYDGGGILPATNPQPGEEKSHDVYGKPFGRLSINQSLGEAISTAYKVPYYTDIEATVDRLDRLKAPQVLAIATHGFSLPHQQDFIQLLIDCPIEAEEKILLDRSDEITPEFRDFWHQAAADGNEWCERILAKIDKIGIHTQDAATVKPNSIDLLGKPTTTDPMLRSGIALAGANIWRFQGTETEKFGKGVVFAHDIAQWDLWGTELALMITCVSGLGAIKNSEGVFGLRRALSIAGAKYVITSLWNIPTKPSVLLMNKFFELYRSAARPTPPQALAQAQTYVRNITLGELKQIEIGRSIVEELQRETVRKLSSTATDDVKPLADPHYWGAWICQG
jgi:tetratricopeptide (TPR) repeat protein